jgi:methionyl-tRNA formyltransferase
MRIGFAGTPAFAATALKAILDQDNPVVVVVSQPDRPHGRGLKTEPGAVAALARRHGIALLQPRSLKSEQERAPLTAVALDVLVVAAYGLILPRHVLDWPKHGSSISRIAPASLARCGADPSARCSPVMPRPASRSCAWMQGSTPVR